MLMEVAMDKALSGDKGSLFTDHEDEGSLYQALEASAMHTTNVRSPFLVIGL